MRRILFPLILGIGGVAVLVWLGLWQLERLAWKEAILADINTRLMSDPVPVPDAPVETPRRIYERCGQWCARWA